MERFLRTEQETLRLRLVAALGAAVGLYVHQEQLSVFWVLFLPVAYSFYVAYSLILRYYLLPRVKYLYVVYGMMVVDTIFLTGIIYVTGGINSALMILFPVFIIYYSIHLGYMGSFVAATVASVGLGVYVLSTGLPPSSERGLGLAIAMFYIAATFSGYLGQRGLRSEAERQALEELLNVERGARSLLDVAATLHSTLELRALLQDITQLSPRLTGLSRCVIMLLDGRAERLLGHATNVDAGELGLSRVDDLAEVLGERSLARRAWATGLPVALSSTAADREELLPPPPELGAGSLLVIPLMSQGHALGVIYAYEAQENHSFTEGELRLAKGFGDLTAIAIANAKLYQEAQEKIASLVANLESAVQRLERMREPRRSPVVNVNGLQIDTSTQKVLLMGQPIELSPTEFRVLVALAEHPGIPVSQEVLFRKTWGDVYRGNTNAVDVYIHRLRKKLEENSVSPKRIVTVRGMGYKLEEGS